MPIFLSKRDADLVEWMDRADCDRLLLENTYRQFTTINHLLSGWENIYRQFIKPKLQSLQGSATVLDIGCGGGDIIRRLDLLCRKDGFNVHFTGIDPDDRSVDFLKKQEWPENISFLSTASGRLVLKERTFDIVISNHLIHHLTAQQLSSVCEDAETLSRHLVVFSDIERSDIGYVSFGLIAPLLFRNSYIVKDGLISIKKSYRKQELQALVPEGWKVIRKFPFRLLAVCKRNSE